MCERLCWLFRKQDLMSGQNLRVAGGLPVTSSWQPGQQGAVKVADQWQQQVSVG